MRTPNYYISLNQTSISDWTVCTAFYLPRVNYVVHRLGHINLIHLDLFEARAILLGRLGRHDQALELYVYRMHDYRKAEE